MKQEHINEYIMRAKKKKNMQDTGVRTRGCEQQSSHTHSFNHTHARLTLALSRHDFTRQARRQREPCQHTPPARFHLCRAPMRPRHAAMRMVMSACVHMRSYVHNYVGGAADSSAATRLSIPPTAIGQRAGLRTRP